MNRTSDDLINEYLKQLDAELSGLPRSSRREVVQEISAHITAARADLVDENEAEIRALLDRLGDPADIAAEARDRFGMQSSRKRNWVEVAALVLLPIGGVILPVVGWFVGVVLLWVSDAWTTRDKLLGTFVVPGGLTLPLYLLFTAVSEGEHCVQTFNEGGRLISKTCSGGPSGFSRIFWPSFVIALVLATLAMTVYLARRIRRTSVALA
jgi:uncharacterized membrane protein